MTLLHIIIIIIIIEKSRYKDIEEKLFSFRLIEFN